MQSVSIPKPTTTHISTNNLNTIERINSLINNLDLKLAQLCCLNCSKGDEICCNNCTKDSALSEAFLLQLTQKTKGQELNGIASEESVEKGNHNQILQPNKCFDINRRRPTDVSTFKLKVDLVGTSSNTPPYFHVNTGNGIDFGKSFKSKIITDLKDTKSVSSKSVLNLRTRFLPEHRKISQSDTKVVKSKPESQTSYVDANIKKIPGLNAGHNQKDPPTVGHILHGVNQAKESSDNSLSCPKTEDVFPSPKQRFQSANKFDENKLQATFLKCTIKTTNAAKSNNPIFPTDKVKIGKSLHLKKGDPGNVNSSDLSIHNIVASKWSRERPTSILKKHLYAKNRTTEIAVKQPNSIKMNMIAYAQPNQQQKKLVIEPQETDDAVQLKTLSTIYRAKVVDAYRNRQIFTVFGNYNTIRRALLKRGWLEKLPPNRYAKLQNLPEDVLLQLAKRGNDYEAVAISKIINHFPAFFVWQAKGQRDLYTDVQPYRNRIRRTHMLDFSTKVGLIGCAEQQLWYLQDGVAGMLYPRFYRLGGNEEEQMAFTEDFRITQCRSLLQYLVMHIEKSGDILDYEHGTVSPIIIHFALGRVRRQLDDWDNVASLDTEPTQIPDVEWNDFMTNSSKILSMNQKIKCTYRELSEFVKTSRSLLSRIVEKRPDFKWDGHKNLWILKPGYQSRGSGIIIRNHLDDILRWSTTHSNRRYIVQKYIEQPLLIYRTKFDIRQHMLVFIRESTVQLWLYKDCYLRFSSQEYSTDDLREVVHLTNNSVQKKYKNKPTRDPRLPKNNMWSLDQFKAYLKTQTPADVWESRVFAGFRENLIAVVMASLDETNLCENCFELYGCDFMLDEQYNPILIEINSTPDMSASTEVTAHICPIVMQDCIKVIVDLPRNGRALTGQFKLVYEVNYKFKQDVNSKDNLNISGKSVELCRRKQLPPVRPKVFKKIKKNEEVINRKHLQGIGVSKKLTPSVPYKTSKTSLRANGGQSLKATTKEALALRYTMPK